MFRKALLIMLAAEAASLLAFVFQNVALPLLVSVAAVTFVAALKRPDLGIYILFGELFVGSRGHLLEAEIFGFNLSLRMVVFAAVFGAWVLKQITNHKSQITNKFQIKNHKFKTLYILLLLVIGWGIIWGIWNGNGLTNVFLDANGYLYLLILPAVVSATPSRETVYNLLKILAAAVVVIALTTLALFVWFGFGWPGVAVAYHWVIDSDIGEITGIVGSASRIFMQSQFYSLVGLFVFGFLYFSEDRVVPRNIYWTVMAAAVFGVIMSLSRSFWLGLAFGGLFALVALVWRFRLGLKKIAPLALIILAISVAEIGAVAGIAYLGGGLSEHVAGRGLSPDEDAAGGARLLLLPNLLDGIYERPLFGSGFGREVSYASFLPERTTADNPDGVITGFAFEWGYLDTLLKIGAAGLLIYLFFIAHIFRQGWNFRSQKSEVRSQTVEIGPPSSDLRVPTSDLCILGVLAGLVALLILNITTPYLNHPLGIGFLIFVYSYLFVIRKDHEAAG